MYHQCVLIYSKQGAWYSPAVTTSFYDEKTDKNISKTTKHFGKLVDQYDRFCHVLRSVNLRNPIRAQKRTAGDAFADELRNLRSLECVPASTLTEEGVFKTLEF